MLKEYQRKTNLGVGLGILAQALARFVLMPKGGAMEAVGWVVLLAGLAVFIWGCCAYMKGKGYHPALGALGILSLLGLIVMIIFPDKHKQGKL